MKDIYITYVNRVYAIFAYFTSNILITGLKTELSPMKFIYTFLAVAIVFQANTQIIYVRSGGNGTGTSWADAQGNLSAALDQATENDQVWVAAGTYIPDATNRDVSFHLKTNVSVLGGFPTTGSPTLDDRVPLENPTILSGDIGMANNNVDNSYSVVTAINVGTTARLDGFIIFNGNASSSETDTLTNRNAGGGLYLAGDDGMLHTPTIENCMFSNNEAHTGGAVLTLATNNTLISPMFKNCSFTENTAMFGAAVENQAILMANNNTQFEDCAFQNNEADESGGAMDNIGDGGSLNLSIVRTAFYNNTSSVGGAIFNFPNDGDLAAEVQNSIFYNNQAESGGAIDNFGFDSDEVNLFVNNCTFTRNIADLGGALSTFGGGVLVQATNSIFWNNFATGEGITASNFFGGQTHFSHCLIQESSCNEGGFEATCDQSIFAQDPLFINPDNLNFQLAPCSPLIDTGTAEGVSETDFAGNNRNFGTTVDIGALEWNGNPGVLTINAINAIDISCNGETNGSIELDIIGGVEPYIFSETLENLSAGTYSIDIVDALGCMTTATATINEPELLSSTATIINHLSCVSVPDGSASVTAFGGTEPYTYLWDNGETTAEATALSAGIHEVTVTDASACQSISSITLDAPPELLVTASIVTTIACGEDSNGVATVNATGGTPDYTYLWDNGSTEINANNLTIGEHCVTVTDANNCTAVSCITLQGSDVLTVTPIIIQELACNGDSNGAASVSVIGGIEPYTYLWENGDTTNTSTNLVAGNHTVTIVDTNDCTAAITVTLDEPTALDLNLTIEQNIDCAGAATGQIAADVSGGTAPYTFFWDNNQTTSIITDLIAGEYCATVTDANGCVIMACVILEEPQEINAQVQITQELLCFGDENGEATILVIGGTPPYNYEWPNGTTGTGLAVGIHEVTIMDANACEHIALVTLEQPNELVITIENITHISETGVNDGSIDISVSGGTGNYTYNWDFGIGNVEDPNGLSPANYTVMVTDENGCSATAMAAVADPNIVTITTITPTDVTCHGEANGSIEITVAGGAMPYTFAWDNGLGGIQNPTNLTAGVYNVTVTDANGSTAEASAEIDEPNALEIINVAIDDIACDGSSTGSVTITVIGGVAPYQYDWGNGIQDSPTTEVLTSGDFQVTVYDAQECILMSEAIVIAIEANITINESVILPSCAGENDGVIDLEVTGGTPPYTYDWADAMIGNTSNPTNLPAGDYEVTITDVNNCSMTIVVTLPDNSVLNAVLTSTPDDGTGNGTATVMGEGGTAPYTYNWVDADMQSTETITDLAAGNYVVIVTDANGCTFTTTVEVMLMSATITLEMIEQLIIFPNPTSGDLNIQLALTTFSNTEISLLDALGSVVLQQPMAKIKAEDYLLNVSTLASGVYFVKIVIEGEVLVQKIFVE